MSLPVRLLLGLALAAAAAGVAATVSGVRHDGYRPAPPRPGGGGAGWSAGDLPSVRYRDR